MDKKVHSMWIYSILIVCVAILLIVISVLSETTVTPAVTFVNQEERNFTSSIEEGVTALIEKNDELENDVAVKKREIEILKELTDGYEKLLKADAKFDEGEIKEAKEMISGIPIENLSEEARVIYIKISEAETEEERN